MHALRPRIDATDLAFARSLLTDPERELFDAMERRDQRHAIAVLTKVRVHTEDHDVLIAALLHDCGKGAVPVWLRILKVVSPTCFPASLTLTRRRAGSTPPIACTHTRASANNWRARLA